jgi:hypothetical protein
MGAAYAVSVRKNRRGRGITSLFASSSTVRSQLLPVPLQWLITLVILSLSLAGCCGSIPRPGFVGVPEEVERSPDLSLPLSTEDTEILLAFLVNGGRPGRGWSLDGAEPMRVEAVRQQYALLISALSREAPATDALRQSTGEIARLFDDPDWVLSVHDARVSRDEGGGFYDLDSGLARAFVKDRFVFAFYQRKLNPMVCSPGTSGHGGTLWVLAPEQSGRFTGLVIFPRVFAVPTPAE